MHIRSPPRDLRRVDRWRDLRSELASDRPIQRERLRSGGGWLAQARGFLGRLPARYVSRPLVPETLRQVNARLRRNLGRRHERGFAQRCDSHGGLGWRHVREGVGRNSSDFHAEKFVHDGLDLGRVRRRRALRTSFVPPGKRALDASGLALGDDPCGVGLRRGLTGVCDSCGVGFLCGLTAYLLAGLEHLGFDVADEVFLPRAVGVEAALEGGFLGLTLGEVGGGLARGAAIPVHATLDVRLHVGELLLQRDGPLARCEAVIEASRFELFLDVALAVV